MRRIDFNALNQTPGNRGLSFLGVGKVAIRALRALAAKAAHRPPAPSATASKYPIFNALKTPGFRARRASPAVRFNALNLAPTHHRNGGHLMSPPE